MRTAAFLAASSVIVTASLSAAVLVHRQNPDLTGTWVATKDAPSGVGMAPSAVFGDRFALKQDASRLTLLRPIRGRATAMASVLPMDGSEVRIMQPHRPCFGQPGQINAVAWEAGAMRFSILGSVAPGGNMTKLAINYLFKKVDADTVVVESTMRDSATGQPKPVGTVYKRSAEVLTPEAPAPPPVAPATISQVAWISGDWLNEGGTAASPSTIEERWSPGNGGAMIATSRTVRGGVMTEFEFLCIAERHGTLVYTAMPNAGTATDFTLTKIDADSATFENPEHNFPKMIRYAKLPDGSLEAVISGAPPSKPITFVFKKK
jgi:hypothetical protein